MRKKTKRSIDKKPLKLNEKSREKTKKYYCTQFPSPDFQLKSSAFIAEHFEFEQSKT